MEQVFLSDTELYYTEPDNVTADKVVIAGDEVKHILNVMRHKQKDIIYVTNGEGKIYRSEILDYTKSAMVCKILEIIKYKNEFENIVVCIPRLKSPERFEFAIEKCVELGAVRFLVYDADRSIARGAKIERWEKIGLAAMKQSLRSFQPEFDYSKSIKDILKNEGEFIWFDQNSDKNWKEISKNDLIKDDKICYLIFGPEGGFSEKETEFLMKHQSYRLTLNRLRAETAIITAVANL